MEEIKLNQIQYMIKNLLLLTGRNVEVRMIQVRKGPLCYSDFSHRQLFTRSILSISTELSLVCLRPYLYFLIN